MLEINKIYLGDSYKLIKEIPDKSVDCIYTDIPYDIQSGGAAGFMKERVNRLRTKDLQGLNDGIDYKIYDEFVRVLKDINVFIWLNKSQIAQTLNYFLKYDITFEILTWNKQNPIPMTSNLWLSDIEYCLYFRSRKIKLNDGYELKSKWFVSPTNKDDKNDYKHAAIKPLELVKRHLLHATQKGDIVLDPFVGSGTTAIACKENERQYIGIEINEKWYKIASDRLNGIKANGQTSIFTDFDLLEKERV